MKRAALFFLFLSACAVPYRHNEKCTVAEPASMVLAEPRGDIEGLPNLGRISPILFRSAQPDAKGFAEAKKLGVKTVINLRWGHSDAELLAGLGLRYVHIPFSAMHCEDEDVIAFLQVVQDPANHPVLVHCQRGADRTGMIVAIYRHFVQGWTLEKAKEEMRRFDFDEVWVNMVEYLHCLDCPQLRERLKSTPPPKIEVIP